VYAVGDKIRNQYDLSGVVTDYCRGRYHVKYVDGREDRMMKASMLKSPRVQSSVRKNSSIGRWINEEVAADYV